MTYREILTGIRQAFPQPVSDRFHDAYFVFSIMRALDQVDGLKSTIPLLGHPQTPDYDTARAQRIPDAPATVEDVTRTLVGTLEGLPNWGHPPP